MSACGLRGANGHEERKLEVMTGDAKGEGTAMGDGSVQVRSLGKIVTGLMSWVAQGSSWKIESQASGV